VSTYSKEELSLMIERMAVASSRFYRDARASVHAMAGNG